MLLRWTDAEKCENWLTYLCDPILWTWERLPQDNKVLRQFLFDTDFFSCRINNLLYFASTDLLCHLGENDFSMTSSILPLDSLILLTDEFFLWTTAIFPFTLCMRVFQLLLHRTLIGNPSFFIITNPRYPVYFSNVRSGQNRHERYEEEICKSKNDVGYFIF